MRGGEHMHVIDERPSAELPSVVEQRHDPRPLVQLRVVTANYTLLVLQLVRLGITFRL